MRVGEQCHASASLPLEKTRYPLYSRLGGSQGRSGWVQQISLPPGLDLRTIQPVASRYTMYVILAHTVIPVLPLYAFMACTGTPSPLLLPLPYLIYSILLFISLLTTAGL